MNKNKIIFWVLWAIIIGLILWGVSILNKQTNTRPTNTQAITSDFSIWIVGDNKTKFEAVVNDFKEKNPTYKNAQIKVESFPSYEEYYTTLQAAFVAGKYPDVFVLNNNEEPIFLEQVEWVNPADFDPNNFRKGFAQFFGDDLIKSTPVDTADGQKNVEFLIGVPVGYETLWVFYNRKFAQAKDVANWAAINSVMTSIKEDNPDVVPVWLGNGLTVPYAADILTQFFMLDGLTNLKDTTGNKMKQGLDSYAILWDSSGDNGYNTLFDEMKEDNKTSLDAFSKEEVAMVFGYPRMIEEINKRGIKKGFLGASPFPNYYNASGRILVNYNYFVINRNSRSIALARAFVLYLWSEAGEKAFLKQFPYYLPAHIALETDFLWEKIHTEYNITLKDFLRSDSVRTSYNKGNKVMYDALISEVLDDEKEYQRRFERAKNYILCQTNKITKLENLSTSCQ